jgi:Ca2+-binding RTX toxin-like protein
MKQHNLLFKAVVIAVWLAASAGVAQARPAAASTTCLGQNATLLGTTGDDVIVGTPGNDIIQGQEGNDVIFGLEGHDLLCGGPGNDRLSGGNGFDALIGEAGNDGLDGGASNDTATYQTSPASVSVNLDPGVASDGFGSRDTLVNIESLYGSNFIDHLRGNDADNYLNGLGGFDSIDDVSTADHDTGAGSLGGGACSPTTIETRIDC